IGCCLPSVSARMCIACFRRRSEGHSSVLMGIVAGPALEQCISMPAEKKLELDLTDEQARIHIRALSVHARDLAAPAVREQNMEQIKRLDALRHDLEQKLDAL